MLFHSGPRFQRGRGLGSLFSGLFRALRPLATMGLKFGKKILTSDAAKSIGSAALDMGKDVVKNVAVDLLEGKNIKESAAEQLNEVKSKLAETLRGSGRKRKRKMSKDENSISGSGAKKKLFYDLLAD